MKVFTVYTGYSYEGGSIEGVFSSYEKAALYLIQKGYMERYPGEKSGRFEPRGSKYETNCKDYGFIEEFLIDGEESVEIDPY